MRKRLLVIGAAGLGLAGLVAVSAGAGAALTYAALHGARPAAAAPAEAADPPAAEAGVLVSSVAPDSPAAQAGLRRGDIVLEVEGQAVNSLAELRRAVQDRAAGDAVALTVLRGDARLTLTAAVTERDGLGFLGVSTCAGAVSGGMLTVAAEPAGTMLFAVVPGSPAEKAGLRAGDEILAVDGQEPTGEQTLADLIGAHQPGDSVTLQVARPGEAAHEVTVTLGEDPDQAGHAYLGVHFFPGLRVEAGGLPWPGSGELERRFGLPLEPGQLFEIPDGVSAGVILGAVTPDSPAERAGLQPGDVITAVGGEPVPEPPALAAQIAAYRPGEQLTLTVRRSGEAEPLTIAVTLGEKPGEPGQAYLGAELAGFFRIDETPGDGPVWPAPPVDFGPDLDA
ncbi:MAG: PDZ domain-containing protein [Anaerolineales bacterium]|nr:PDZ domain-containing protein [Anaerolineales bacterium]